jgi:hypothetical protein
VSWDSRFAESIVLPDGAKLASLRESIAHVVKTIPAAERRVPVVLTAAELLTNAAEQGGARRVRPYRDPAGASPSRRPLLILIAKSHTGVGAN